jgi:hypothetical protein
VTHVEMKRIESKKRRDELRELGKCINAPLNGDVGMRGVVHGPAVGVRCEHCKSVHRGKRAA